MRQCSSSDTFIAVTALSVQRPRSNFEIGEGGGAPLVSQYWGGGGGTRHLFLLTLYNYKNIGGGGHVSPGPPCGSHQCDTGVNFPFRKRSLLFVTIDAISNNSLLSFL